MKTVVLQNIVRAGATATPLALKSFSVLAFDGIKVIARPEPLSAAEPMTKGPLLQVNGAAALGDGLRLPPAKNGLSVAQPSSLHEMPEQANLDYRRLGAGAGPGYRHWGINE